MTSPSKSATKVPEGATILVTGAAGTTGREVVKSLAATGKFKVRAGVRDIAKAQKLFEGQENVQCVKLDDTEAVAKAAFEGVYGVYLLIPNPVAGDLCFSSWLKQAKDVGVKHLVFHSSLTALPSNPVPSNQITYKQEQEIRGTGLHFTFLRPTFFHQNTEKIYIPQIAKGVIVASSNGGRYTVVDVRDIAAAASVVFLDPQAHFGKAYGLTNEITTDYEHVKLLTEALGRPIQYINIPRLEYKAIISKRGLPATLQEILVTLDQEKEEELSLPLRDDLRQLIGRPGISFRQYMLDFASSLSSSSNL